MPTENFAKIFFDRALNRGRRTESRVLFGYFLHDAKSTNPYSLAGSFEVLQTSIQRTQITLRTNKIKSFCRFAAVSLPGRHTSCAFSPPCGGSFPTFCKVQKVGQKTLKLSCLLETWSPCSRPFAILPVSAVSDAQKLATGNFLHVRAATFSYFL